MIDIAMPESLGEFFDEVMSAHGVKYECTGMGCGSCEFSVNAGLADIRRILREAVNNAVALEEDDEDV